MDLSSGECNVISLHFLCYSVNGSDCLVCCVFDSVCELIGETFHNMFGCDCYFVVECYGSVEIEWRCSAGYTVYGLPKMCVVPVITVFI